MIQLDHKDKRRKLYWLCRCDCGKEKIVRVDNLKNGGVKSCGCLNIERSTKHGHAKNYKKSRTYQSWFNMVQRCTNSNGEKYPIYGGRGIKVCNRWRKFKNFLEDMGERPREHQIDRIDNDRNYCKNNCRWATLKQQARNKTNNHLITHDGKTQCLVEWAEDVEIPYKTLWRRVCDLNWSVRKALTTPVKKRGK